MPESGNKPARTAQVVAGTILVAAGALLAAASFFPGTLSIGKLWPLFLLIPVAIFVSLLLRYGRKAEGVWVPLVILAGYAAYFLWLNFAGWQNAGTTWPLYMLFPGLGLFALYLSNRQGGLLIPVAVLVGLTVVFMAPEASRKAAGGAALIVFGAALIFMTATGKKK